MAPLPKLEVLTGRVSLVVPKLSQIVDRVHLQVHLHKGCSSNNVKVVIFIQTSIQSHFSIAIILQCYLIKGDLLHQTT